MPNQLSVQTIQIIHANQPYRLIHQSGMLGPQARPNGGANVITLCCVPLIQVALAQVEQSAIVSYDNFSGKLSQHRLI